MRSRPSEPPQCRRRWKKLTRESPRAFTLMSYNTLADSLLFQNRYLYYHAPPYCLSWNYRKFRLINEVRRYQASELLLSSVLSSACTCSHLCLVWLRRYSSEGGTSSFFDSN